jgi:hypothetical protein
MKRYIKLNSNKEIIDLFHEHVTERMDGTEIFLDEVEEQTVYINGKCISDDIGNPLFKYEEGKIIEIDTYKPQLEAYKKEQQNATTKSELSEIDIKSIRSIREWLAKQPDAPEFIKQYETEAITKRSELK